jgi:hypothetical protein
VIRNNNFVNEFVPHFNLKALLYLFSPNYSDGLEYLHHSPVSRKRRSKGNPVTRGITGPPCPWEKEMLQSGRPGSGSLRWDSKVWLGVLSDSDHWVIALQTADPSYRRRGRPTDTRQQLSDSNLPTRSNVWSQVSEWAWHQDILTDWLTDWLIDLLSVIK